MNPCTGYYYCGVELKPSARLVGSLPWKRFSHHQNILWAALFECTVSTYLMLSIDFVTLSEMVCNENSFYDRLIDINELNSYSISSML